MKTAIQIQKAFGNKLVGNKKMKYFVCSVLLKMPDETIDYITKTCWFMASFDDAFAFTFTGNDLKDKHLVFLSDELMVQPAAQIRFTIAHEVGHVILKHRNSVFENQTKIEIKQQEKEANEFAMKFAN